MERSGQAVVRGLDLHFVLAFAMPLCLVESRSVFMAYPFPDAFESMVEKWERRCGLSLSLARNISDVHLEGVRPCAELLESQIVIFKS